MTANARTKRSPDTTSGPEGVRVELLVKERSGHTQLYQAGFFNGALFARSKRMLPMWDPIEVRVLAGLTCPSFMVKGRVAFLINDSVAEQLGRTPGFGIQVDWVQPGFTTFFSTLGGHEEQRPSRAIDFTMEPKSAAPDEPINRRRFRRFDLHLPVELPLVGDDLLRTSDACVGGVLVETPDPHPVGTQFQMRIHHNVRPYWIHLRGEVVRVDEAVGELPVRMAVRFVDLIHRDRPGFEGFLRSNVDETEPEHDPRDQPYERTAVMNGSQLLHQMLESRC